MAFFSSNQLPSPTRQLDQRFLPPWDISSRASLAPARHEVIASVEGTLLDRPLPALFNITRWATRRFDPQLAPLAIDCLHAAREGLGDGTEEAFPAPHHPLHLVSMLPTSLRHPISAILNRAGLLWDSDVFRGGRLAFAQAGHESFPAQVAFKASAILSLMGQSDGHIHLLGSRRGADAFVFLGVYYWTSHILSDEGFTRFLMIGGVSENLARSIATSLKNHRQSRVASLLIRDFQDAPPPPLSPLTAPLTYFRSYLEVSLRLAEMGLARCEDLWPLVRQAHNVEQVELTPIYHMLSDWMPVNPRLQQTRAWILDQLASSLDSLPARTSPALVLPRPPLDEDSILAMLPEAAAAFARVAS
jgi:hypothetical protein